MIDVIGGISLAVLAVVLVGTIVFSATSDSSRRWRYSLIAALWFFTIATLGALGVFAGSFRRGLPLVAAALLIPVITGTWMLVRSSAARAAAFRVPLGTLVAVNAGRLLGVFFLILFAAGRLPRTFALTAGWGDILVAAAALPVAWMIHRRATGWWSATAIWNTIGFLDLITAVSLGIGSAANSPLQFIFETPGSSAITTLPWVMVPAFLVPIYLVLHITVFTRLAAAARLPEDAGRRAPPAAPREIPAL